MITAISLFLVATLCLRPTPIGVAVGDEGTVFVADATLTGSSVPKRRAEVNDGCRSP